MERACPTPLTRCWLTALRLNWRMRLAPDAAEARLARLLASMGLGDSAGPFAALVPALYADGARCLDIREIDDPDTTLDERALLDALCALCLDDPLAAENALAGLFPPGRGRRSLCLLDEIAAGGRRLRPAMRDRWRREESRLQ